MTAATAVLWQHAGMGHVHSLPTMFCCLAAMTVIAALHASGSQQEPPTNVVRRGDPDIEAVLARLDKAWNDRDAPAFGAVFTPDATFETPNSAPALDGRPEIEKHFAGRFAGYSPDLRHRTTVTAVRDISSDLALVDGGVEILRTGAAGSSDATVIRKFALSAGMQRTKEGLSIRWLRAYLVASPR